MMSRLVNFGMSKQQRCEENSQDPPLNRKLERQAALTWSWGRHLGALPRWRWPRGRCVDWSSSRHRTLPPSQRNLICARKTKSPPLFIYSKFTKISSCQLLHKCDVYFNGQECELLNKLTVKHLIMTYDRCLHTNLWFHLPSKTYCTLTTYFTEPLIFVWSSSWNLYW